MSIVPHTVFSSGGSRSSQTGAPTTEFGTKTYYYRVCQEFCPQGGCVYPSMYWGRHPLPSACWDTHPRADTPLGRHPLGRHPLGRHPWANTPPRQTSPPSWPDACLGRHPPGQTPPWADTPQADTTAPPPGHCSGAYASSFNAFLLGKIFAEICMKMKEVRPVEEGTRINYFNLTVKTFQKSD